MENKQNEQEAQTDRRKSPRRKTDLWINKFIDGMPYMARVVELSEAGCLLEGMLEPEVFREVYPLEIALPHGAGGGQLWLWSRTVWRDSARVALRFVGLGPVDRGALGRFLERL